MDENREIEEFLRKFETVEPSGGTERELLKMARQKSYEQIRARTETSRFRLVATAVLLASTVAALYLIISAAPLGQEIQIVRVGEHLTSKPLPAVDEQVKMPASPQVPTRIVEVIEPQEVFSKHTGSLAVVFDLIGEVTVAGKALRRGDTLGKGALVETGAGSMCAIAGRDGSNFKLNTQTTVRFVDLTEPRLIEIEKGELWADAAPITNQSTPLIVKTPNSRATILGTEFSLTVTSYRTLLSVKEGSVSLESSSGKATVSASEQCLVTSQKPPVVRRLVHLANRFGWTALLSSEGQHPVEKSRSAATFVGSEGSVGTLVAKIDDNWKPLTLSRQHITVVIEGGVARTTVEEAFYNNTGSQLEGQFKFPLPKDASICRFAMTVDPEGRKLMEGSIVERTYARQIYESIIARKRDPGLLEWQSGSTFSARIFPIFPRSEKRIFISYTQPVSTHAGLSRYTYPMVGSLMTSMPPEDFQLVVMLKTSGKIISLDCPSHNVGIARDSDSCVRLGFAAKKYSARNNFVLLWDEDAEGQDVVQTSGAQGYALLRLRPDLSSFPAEKPERVVLLVDTSASIAPNEREIIYNVVEKILTNLGFHSEFLIGFVDVGTRFPGDGFEKATPENIEKALAEVWSADSAGATNLQKCAENLSEALTNNSPATVIYIGDGQPTMGETHLPELTALFKNKLSDRVNRFFAVAVGSDADEMMLRSISSSLRGTHIVLLPGGNLLDKILGLCEEINQPILTDATLTVEGELLQNIYPATIPPIPAGGECIVVAKYNGVGKVSATLKGKVAEREYQKIIQFTTGEGDVSETTLGRIWAQRRISDLLSTNTGGANKEEIIALSKSFSIVTPYTSLLVLETEEEYKRYSIERKPRAPDEAKQPTADFTVDSSGDIHVYTYPYGTTITSSVTPPTSGEKILEKIPIITSIWSGDVTTSVDTPTGHDTPIPRGTSFDELHDKNLDSTSVVDAYGIGGGQAGDYGQRWGKGSLAREGGSPGTENCVMSGLRWPALHQDSDGKWDCDNFMRNCKDTACTGAGLPEYDVMVTSLSELAFLGNGHTQRVGQHKKTVKKALEWLISQQQGDGSMGKNYGRFWILNHATATQALCEAYAMTRDARLQSPAQRAVDFLLSAKSPGSGWGFNVRSGPNSLATGWAILSLKAAKVAKLTVPDEAFADALKFFDSVTDQRGWTYFEKVGEADPDFLSNASQFDTLPEWTAVSALCRILCGQPRTEANVLRGVDILMQNPPIWDKPNCKKVNMHYWYWGTNALFQYGGEKWQKWNEAMKKALLDTQRIGGCADGSWDPVDKWGMIGGRVFATAINCLALEVYYRYARQSQATPPQKAWKAWAELLTLLQEDEELPKESYDKILADKHLEEIIEKAKRDHNSEEANLLNRLFRAYPDWNASEEECQKISRKQDEILKALVTIWPYDVKHSVKSAMLAFERFPRNEALLLLGEEVGGTSRLDILMQNLPREVVIRILEALIDIREDASPQTTQNEKLLRLKKKIYKALWPEFGRREDFVRTFAIILSAGGEKENFIRLLSSNIDISPDDPFKRAEFATSLRQAGYFAEACEQYEEAIRLRPEEASYYVAAAECADATGESGSKKAEELYTTVLKMNLNEDNPLVVTASEKLLALYERQLAAFTASGDDKGAVNIAEKIRKLKEKKLVCAELRVILRWDTGNTDVDLWVTPSEDQKCSYQQMRTLRGGKLDKDVTSGYGPETFTMSQLRPGKYLVQVNYFSGGPKTSGTVEIITNEGTEKEKKTTSTFTLRNKGEVVTIFDGELK